VFWNFSALLLLSYISNAHGNHVGNERKALLKTITIYPPLEKYLLKVQKVPQATAAEENALKWFDDWFCCAFDCPFSGAGERVRRGFPAKQSPSGAKKAECSSWKRALPAAGDKCIKIHSQMGKAAVKLFGKLIFLTFNRAFNCLFSDRQKVPRGQTKSKPSSEVETLNYLYSLHCVMFFLSCHFRFLPFW